MGYRTWVLMFVLFYIHFYGRGSEGRSSCRVGFTDPDTPVAKN